jgi:hypothetical protein
MTTLLVLGGLAVLAFATAALVVSALDDDEDDAGAPTQPTVMITPPTTMPPAPPEPPPPAPDAPAGPALVARVVTNARAAVTTTWRRVRLSVVSQEGGVCAVRVPALSAAQRQQAQIRARAANGTRGAAVSARGFEFAVFLPKEDPEATAAKDDGGRPELRGTR